MTKTEYSGIIYIDEQEGSSVENFENAERYGFSALSGEDVAREELRRAVNALLAVDIHPDDLDAETETFEEMFVALYAWKLKLMLDKQRDYGSENISKAGQEGVLTRATDKVERGKVLIGDAKNQVERIRTLLNSEEPETLTEMNTFLNNLEDIVNPQSHNESILDTWVDLGNYGDIGVTLHVDAWPKPMREEL